MSFGKEWFKVSLSPKHLYLQVWKMNTLGLEGWQLFLSFCSILKLSRKTMEVFSMLIIWGSCAHTSPLAISSWRISYNVFWSHSPSPPTIPGHSYMPPCVSLVATFCFLSARIWNRFSGFFSYRDILCLFCLRFVWSQSVQVFFFLPNFR